MIIKDEQKVVDYFGMRLTVPNDVESIATDECGEVWAYYDKPELNCCEWTPSKQPAFLCTAHLDGMDWRDTLMEV